MHQIRKVVWLLLSLLAVCFAPSSQAAWRIMCLGDSITGSFAGYASYRYWLWQDIKNNPAGVDFVGYLTQHFDGPPLYSDFDKNHEGHWGARADQIAGSISGWATTYKPDIVLLHVGTNDLFLGKTAPQTAGDIQQIITRLRAVNPRIVVLVAQIIPSTLQEVGDVNPLNYQIANVASNLNTSQSPVVAVNQAAGFNPFTDLFDGLHPNQTGEIKIADRWLAVLAPYLNRSPGPTSLIQPATCITDHTPTFMWTKAAGATRYHLWINRNGSEYLTLWVEDAIRWTPGTSLPNGDYTWWIRPSNPHGDGAWSAPSDFSLEDPLVKPTGLSPNAQTVVNRKPTLRWSAVSGATWYRVWLNRDEETHLTKWVEGSTSWTPVDDLPCGNYQWWVTAWNPCDESGPWSTSATFTIDCCVPAQPTGAQAESGPGTDQVTYSVHADACATWYQVWINQAGRLWQKRWYNTGLETGEVDLVMENQLVGNYDYWVQGWSEDGFGPWTGKKALALGKVTPTYPLGTAGTPSRLQWDRASEHSATWFYLWIEHANGDLYYKKWVQKNETATTGSDRYYNLPAAIPSGSYKWWVRTWEPDAYSVWSATAEVTVP